ncbi:porphobilinogen synthase [Chitinophagales bacterium]|nr:porphobilinogen synthase [Chitinophagales bacterium]
MELLNRPRRMRRTAHIRNMVAETRFHPKQLIYPLFIKKRGKRKQAVSSMAGQYRFPLAALKEEVEILVSLGQRAFLLFGVGEPKDDMANSAADDDGVIPTALRMLKQEFGSDIVLFTDVCLCAYMSHGHCGVLDGESVLNDETLPILADIAVCHASSGADFVAPSDMMDGRVAVIRDALDLEDFGNTGIMSYSTKFASAYYGPFTDATDSALVKGDRTSYQLDYRNGNEAIRESLADEEEGADILMVKPAMAYLDVIASIKSECDLPVAAYQVSGHYAMTKLAVQNGLAQEEMLVRENMHALCRAGADLIISYHAKDIWEKKWFD